MLPPTREALVFATLAGGVLVVAAAALFRSRSYAVFRGVQLTIYGLIAVALYRRALETHAAVAWLFLYLHACVHLQSLMLVWPRMRPLAYRALVSLPDAFFQAGTILGLPWAVAGAFGLDLPGWWAGYLLAAAGMAQSVLAREEEIDVVLRDEARPDRVVRHRRGADRRSPRPLRLVQLTDPHLGPFMAQARLRRCAERAGAREPDLVLLTGDFLTMESQSDPSLLAGALAPLKALEGRVFACLGNHDLEAPRTVKKALAEAGVRLLVDEAALVETEAGPVQIVGADFRWRKRAEHLRGLVAAHPRVEGALRLLLLHDPAAFKHLPEGEADLVLSGHTHGGQLGLVSLGLPGTFISAFSSSPDHGLWARGRDRLYVHRGTGHYGFPIRLGVPAESSLLRVHVEE